MKITHAPGLALLLLALCGAARGQATQTLPRFFEAMPGNAQTSAPVNTANDQILQWHYDSSEFAMQAPITITQLAIRPKPGFIFGPFNFPSFRVTLCEAATNYAPSDRDPVLGRNILRSKVVRTGPFTGGPFVPLPGSPVGGFVSLGLTEPFTYDPSTGNDLIIQIQKCGTNLTWGVPLDAESGPLGTVGGHTYGHFTDCESSVPGGAFMIFGIESVPIVRITYRPATQTLPQGFDQVDGNGTVGFPVTTAANQKWQWHYDSEEFDVQGPIAIREIRVRARGPADALAAFSFASFRVTLGLGSTDYRFVNHLPQFAANIEGQKVVRTGVWAGGAVPPSGGPTATWVALGLSEPFVFDPSDGQDFVLQIEKCGSATPWSVGLDGVSLPAGTGGGNRYGHTTDCAALTQNSASSLFDIVPIIQLDYEPLTQGAGAITRFPWREEFDGGSLGPLSSTMPQGWLNVDGAAPQAPGLWLTDSGPTPAFNTGPNADHTSGAGRFAFVESGLSDNRAVSLLTPCLDLGALANPRLDFWLHSMNALGAPGPGESFLSVDVLVMPDGPRVLDVIPPIGHFGAFWNEISVDLTAFAGETVRIRFRVDTDNGMVGHDVAIDDVHVYEPTVQVGQVPSLEAALDANGALEPNGEPVTFGLAGPYSADVFGGEDLGLTISGNPGQPFLLFTGSLAIGLATFPGIGQVDVGPGIVVVIDGVSGMGLVPGVFFTDAAGDAHLPGPSTLPPGLTLPLQAAVFTGGPGIVALSNALVVETR